MQWIVAAVRDAPWLTGERCVARSRARLAVLLGAALLGPLLGWHYGSDFPSFWAASTRLCCRASSDPGAVRRGDLAPGAAGTVTVAVAFPAAWVNAGAGQNGFLAAALLLGGMRLAACLLPLLAPPLAGVGVSIAPLGLAVLVWRRAAVSA